MPAPEHTPLLFQYWLEILAKRKYDRSRNRSFPNLIAVLVYPTLVARANIQYRLMFPPLLIFGSTVRYEMMKLCAVSV